MMAAATLTPTLTAHRNMKMSRHSLAAACAPIWSSKRRRRNSTPMPEIQALLTEINADSGSYAFLADGYSRAAADRLKTTEFDRVGMGARNLPYERLDQLTFDVLMGVR